MSDKNISLFFLGLWDTFRVKSFKYLVASIIILLAGYAITGIYLYKERQASEVYKTEIAKLQKDLKTQKEFDAKLASEGNSLKRELALSEKRRKENEKAITDIRTFYSSTNWLGILREYDKHGDIPIVVVTPDK